MILNTLIWPGAPHLEQIGSYLLKKRLPS